jgi:hypothetical protein
MRLVSKAQTIHLSHLHHLVSSYESSPERVKDLAEALELAILNAKACGSSIIVDQDCLDHIFVCFPSGSIGLYKQCGKYEIEPEPELQVRIIPKGSAIYGEHGEIIGHTQEDTPFYYMEATVNVPKLETKTDPPEVIYCPGSNEPCDQPDLNCKSCQRAWPRRAKLDASITDVSLVSCDYPAAIGILCPKCGNYHLPPG